MERLRVYCLSVCHKLNISLLLQNYLSYYPHIWHEGYFQQYTPDDSHWFKVKAIKAISKTIPALLRSMCLSARKRTLKAFLKLGRRLFLAHLNISRGVFRIIWCLSSIVRHASSTFSLNIFSQTAGPIWNKLGRNVPLEVLFLNCSHNLIPS